MLDQALRMNLEQHKNYLSLFFHLFLYLLLHQIRHSLDVFVKVNLATNKVELLLEDKDYTHNFSFSFLSLLTAVFTNLSNKTQYLHNLLKVLYCKRASPFFECMKTGMLII